MDLESSCPYCGEPVSFWIDEGGGEKQDYIEDCAVCCRPCRVLAVLDGEGGGELRLEREDE